jgi:integrase/recombinase XerD
MVKQVVRYRRPRSPADAVLRFRLHLQHVRGATEKTCTLYAGYVSGFLVGTFGAGVVDLAGIGPRDVIDFVERKAKHWRPKTTKLLATALRSFFRFMRFEGQCDARLVDAVPTIPEWKLSRLPVLVSDPQLRSMLGAFDRQTAVGRRDFAIALCLSRLALRAGEVAQLGLDDIDWRGGSMAIVGKSRRASRLPLPLDVGQAIVQYLRRGRPRTDERRVFVRHLSPVGGAINAGTVRSVIRRAYERAGVHVVSKGTHALRHTAASRMVCGGATLKQIADVLRHRSLDTTAIYAKVDLPRLAQVALAWPKVRS